MADLLAAGMWSQFANLKDTELHRLELEVPDTLLRGKADSILLGSTVEHSRYGSCGQRQRGWC